jgi:drug/metabolite transporter (DMT)-like permease
MIARSESSPGRKRGSVLIQLLSGLFVLIWATGFIVAGVVSTRADPLTFLTARHGLSIVVFTALSLAVRAAWPRDWRAWRDAAIAGMLLHGFYIGGVFWAVSHGLGAGMTALVTGLHPLFTAALALPLLHERLGPRQWIGIAVGVLGVALIVAPKLGGVDSLPLHALAVALVATLSLTLGTIWQKYSKPGRRPSRGPRRPTGSMPRAPRCGARSRGRCSASPWAGSRSFSCCSSGARLRKWRRCSTSRLPWPP